MENTNNQYFVKVNNNWFKTKDNEISLLDKYNSLTFMVYVVIRKTLTMRNTFTFTLSSTCNALGIDRNKNSSMVKRVKESILSMNNDLYIIYNDSYCKEKLDEDIELHKLYFCKSTYMLEDKFFAINDFEIDKIVDIERNNRLEKGTLFTQFAYICKSFGGQEKDKEGNDIDNFGICYPSLDTIEKNTLICEKTILKNNKLLADNNLLLIGNGGMNIVDDTIKNVSNLYARPIYEEQFNRYLEKVKSTVTIKNNNLDKRAKQNEMRKLSQLMNNYRKNNNLFETEDLTDIEFKELNKLEVQYFNLAKNKDGKVKRKVEGHRFLTITLDGKVKERIKDNSIAAKVIPLDRGNSNKLSLEDYYNNPNNADELNYKIEELDTRLKYGEDPEEFDVEDKYIYDNFIVVSEDALFEMINNM